MKLKRKYPIGAEIVKGRGVHFRVWAPDHSQVTLVLEKKNIEPQYHQLKREDGGYHSIFIPKAATGTWYRYKLGNDSLWFADPASRFQPEGPIGPSCVVDPSYPWTDNIWRGLDLHGQIIYEMHMGTFTKEGTFKAAQQQLKYLADLGVTVLEIMPLNDFTGDFGWGYDGVSIFSPSRLYGTPDDVKSFINAAHCLGLGVILDIVYNHLGPEGNQLIQFAKEYLSEKHASDWGKIINFDSPSVREFYLTNMHYWLDEFHFDGFRVDATPCLLSSTAVHILTDLSRVVRNYKKRKAFIIGENESQNTHLLRAYEEGGHEFHGLWNDDFHHTALVRLTGKREAYYTDYLGSPQEFISSVKYGFLYQGQYYDWQKKERGVPHLSIKSERLIVFLENHDQVANSGYGKRLHDLSDFGNYKALTCLLLLGPNTPMLFQGQEYGSSHPFYYFADHSDKLRKLVEKGRKASLAQFPRLATGEVQKAIPDPSDPLTFTKCKLDLSEREKNPHLYSLHKDLIKLRRTDIVFKSMTSLRVDGSVLSTDSFLIRFFLDGVEDRLIIFNFGCDHYFNPAPEPLLVAGVNLKWKILWSSESVAYGGEGTPPMNVPHWKILGHSAVVLKTVKKKNREHNNN